ncbi:DAK2 domain-containing protein [Cohnella sp. CFH 77786]|uniref:DAK2 domain-containing protein n=1 Tax=Cohnella sp. CFH 77786 TaxID=2662265 RepID=UPI001C60A839|nr:DAK2 domain-containing protein [Cohnella sp. CFH 77786]MBW5444660.1 DAK2 domain-containing protein [Cohnella sp. CFH 77786]
MSRRSLNGKEWTAMVLAGAARLSANESRINALNVFPVPDGDTGTNMNLTMTAGVAELNHKPSDEVGRAAEALSKGLLMGARGNSGVILSQLFRGFARAAQGEREMNATQFANALQQGVDTAYKAVVKPVEGTILTVAREAARQAATSARRTADLTEFMREVLAKASETLNRTPEMLPVLKQVGVVDSGGQGLVCLYEGFLAYLTGMPAVDTAGETMFAAAAAPAPQASRAVPAPKPSAGSAAQAKLETESIDFPYDMEFFIQRAPASAPFPEKSFRQALERDGDSIILIEDGDIVKVHVHSRRPGDVLNYALAHGELTHLHILNMREQHRELLRPAAAAAPGTAAPQDGTAAAPVAPKPPEGAEALGLEAASGIPAGEYELAGVTASPESEPNPDAHEMAAYGVVAVSVGEGNAELFRSLGVDVVLSGGQSMNPSTEDLLGAIHSLSAQSVLVLPNNPNILLAAKQAAELADRPVTVLPTRTIPQGMAAMLAFQEEDSESANVERMTKAFERVLTGSVTQAVRDTQMDGLDIRAGQYIGILDKTIVAAADSAEEAGFRLLERMLSGGGEIVTILTGEGAAEEQAERLEAWLGERYPDAEVETHEGGQPLYPFLFAVEP